MLYDLFCGVDISARTFTAATLSAQPNAVVQKALDFKQTPTDFAGLADRLLAKNQRAARVLVVLEATGMYWIELASYLVERGLKVSVVNPKHSHNFARALGQRHKNDAVDAQMLAQMGASLARSLTLWTPPPAIYRELYQRLMLRQSLLETRKALANQLQALPKTQAVSSVVAHYQSLLADLDGRLKNLQKEIEKVLAGEPKWAATVGRLKTIPGVGWVSAVWLVVITLNFTTCPSPEALTQYIGLAPTERTSGTSVRGRARLGGGGHALMRSILYMAAGTAMRWNPALKSYAARLRAEQGKAPKVVRCAVARKLIHLAFALVKNECDFEADYRPKPVSKGQSAGSDVAIPSEAVA